MGNNKVTSIIASLFILIWLYASISKLYNYGITNISIKSQPLPPWSKDFLLWFIPSIELFLALLLSFNKTRHLGLIGSTQMMLLFSGYVIYVLHLSKESIPCSCGGLISKLGWKGHLYFTITGYLLGLIATLQFSTDNNLRNKQSDPLH